MSRRPLSLQTRSLLAAGIALAAFLGLTGFALDQAIYETLHSALRDRLQSYVYGYLGASDVARSRRWLPRRALALALGGGRDLAGGHQAGAWSHGVFRPAGFAQGKSILIQPGRG